jgi:hypothetical protein
MKNISSRFSLPHLAADLYFMDSAFYTYLVYLNA